MPRNGRRGGASSGQGMDGALARMAALQDFKMKETLDEMRIGTGALAAGLGMEEDSFLDKAAHENLAAQVQALAAMDAKLQIKRAATASALKSMAVEMDRRAAMGDDEPTSEEVDVSHFLDVMRDKVTSAMQGADEKALESKTYQDLMKCIVAPTGDDDDIFVQNDTQASLKCPITSTTFVDPVKSEICGHTFSRAAINHHIKVSARNGSGGAPCPIPGCHSKVPGDKLVVDKDMARRLRIESNTQATLGPGDDAEELDDDDIGESHI